MIWAVLHIYMYSVGIVKLYVGQHNDIGNIEIENSLHFIGYVIEPNGIPSRWSSNVLVLFNIVSRKFTPDAP